MKNSKKSLAIITILLVMFQTFGMLSVSSQELNSNQDSQVAAPRTIYIAGGGSNFTRSGSNMTLNVTTTAFSRCDIYHTVLVYKNGVLIYSNTLYSVGQQLSLGNSLPFSASSGDYFQAYVTHYTSKSGIIEEMETYKSATY